MIKYKDEIASRPKKEWFQSKADKQDVKQASKQDVGKKEFMNKREEKMEDKKKKQKIKKVKLQPGESRFGEDREPDSNKREPTED